jgi:hypothetical protein
MATGSPESIERELLHQVDRLLAELAVDREELIAESGRQGGEIMQKGLSNVAEVVSGLHRLRQTLTSD